MALIETWIMCHSTLFKMAPIYYILSVDYEYSLCIVTVSIALFWTISKLFDVA